MSTTSSGEKLNCSTPKAYTQWEIIISEIVFLLLCILDLNKIVAIARKLMKYIMKLQAHKYENKNAPPETISILCRIAWTRSPSV